MTVHGDGKQVRRFSYVTDTVAGIVKASEVKKAEGQIFNIGNSGSWTILELAEMVKRVTHSKSPIRHVPYKDYYGLSYEDTPVRIPDISKAREILGFEPRISLEEGLRRTIQWMRERAKEREACPA